MSLSGCGGFRGGKEGRGQFWVRSGGEHSAEGGLGMCTDYTQTGGLRTGYRRQSHITED